MKGNIILATAAATLLLTGCFHDNHDLQPGTVGFAPTLRWEQPEDAGTPVHHVYLIVNGSGVSYTREFTSVEAVSSELQQLPEGDYEVLVTVNMSEADGFQLEGLPPTKLFGFMVRARILRLIAGYDVCFGVAPIRPGSATVQPIYLGRALAKLSVNVNNVPADMHLTANVTNAAQTLDLTGVDDNGHQGRPSDELDSRDIKCGNGETINLMPTASGQEHSTITINKVGADGSVEGSFNVTGPVMQAGKAYNLNLDYNDLLPEMTVSSSAINDWTDAWTIQGTVPDPE